MAKAKQCIGLTWPAVVQMLAAETGSHEEMAEGAAITMRDFGTLKECTVHPGHWLANMPGLPWYRPVVPGKEAADAQA